MCLPSLASTWTKRVGWVERSEAHRTHGGISITYRDSARTVGLTSFDPPYRRQAMNATTPAHPKTDERLRQSMTVLERALGRRTAGREYQWSASVADALDQLRGAVQS